MIPVIALSAMGMKMSTTASLLSTKTAYVQMRDDALMASMKRMMQDMHNQPMKGNIDLDFATMLKVHHQGAIAMSKIELQHGKDAAMKMMAQQIVDKQTREVEELDQLIASQQNAPKNYDSANKTSGPGKAMSDNMMRMMKIGKMSMSSVDHEFADLMVKHHQDGIVMSKSIIAYSKTAKLKSMAQKAIPGQANDIQKMEKWMKSHR